MRSVAFLSFALCVLDIPCRVLLWRLRVFATLEFTPFEIPIVDAF